MCSVAQTRRFWNKDIICIYVYVYVYMPCKMDDMLNVLTYARKFTLLCISMMTQCCVPG